MAELNDEIKTVTKRRKRDLEFGQEYVNPGDNAKAIESAMSALALPPIDNSDPVQVEQRCRDYIADCAKKDVKPTKVGLAIWLRVTLRTLERWKNGEVRAQAEGLAEIIEQYFMIIESVTVNLMLDNKINPANGIFILKNLHGYKDSRDIFITPNNPLGEEADTKKLEDKYAESVIDTTGTDVTEE